MNDHIPTALLSDYFDIWSAGTSTLLADEGPTGTEYKIPRDFFKSFGDFASFAHELAAKGGGID